MKTEENASKKVLAGFKKTFADSWRRTEIRPLINRLELQFVLNINNSERREYKGKKILFNQHSLSFDYIF